MNKNISLHELKSAVADYGGVKRKNPIEDVFLHLVTGQKWGMQLPNYGDDAAVIPNGEGYLLLAADGIMANLIKKEPYAAGKAAIMVCANDIYAMGGRPLAMVNVLGCSDETMRRDVIEGIKKGCDKLRVPMLGGHLHPDSPLPSLSVATLGFARKLLRGHLADDGQDIIFAVDLDGRPGCKSVTSWDTNSGKSSEQIIHRLEMLPLIAEKELANCCKDISNAGLLGTIAIMIENSGKGAVIDIERIPIPPNLDLVQWCLCFQSYGFVLSVQPNLTEQVIGMFASREITAAVVGQVRGDRKIILKQGLQEETLFDFEIDKITGICS